MMTAATNCSYEFWSQAAGLCRSSGGNKKIYTECSRCQNWWLPLKYRYNFLSSSFRKHPSLKTKISVCDAVRLTAAPEWEEPPTVTNIPVELRSSCTDSDLNLSYFCCVGEQEPRITAGIVSQNTVPPPPSAPFISECWSLSFFAASVPTTSAEAGEVLNAVYPPSFFFFLRKKDEEAQVTASQVRSAAAETWRLGWKRGGRLRDWPCIYSPGFTATCCLSEQRKESCFLRGTLFSKLVKWNKFTFSFAKSLTTLNCAAFSIHLVKWWQTGSSSHDFFSPQQQFSYYYRGPAAWL